MTHYIGHLNGRIVFSTSIPEWHSFVAPDGMDIIEVDRETYERVSRCGGASVIFVNGSLLDIPGKPGEFYDWSWESKSWSVNFVKAEVIARAKRSALLSSSDWTQLPDITIEKREAWAAYRKHLRDIPDQQGFPFEIVWPAAPNSI